jgi:hypothetical protein
MPARVPPAGTCRCISAKSSVNVTDPASSVTAPPWRVVIVSM